MEIKMEMETKVKESTLVRPMTATPRTTLWLSSLDLLIHENYHTRSLYFFPFNGHANFFDIGILKTALSHTLVQFYPMAGRLKRPGDRIEIDCNDEGALFVLADCDRDMAQLDDYYPRPDLSLVPPIDYSRGISSFPLSLLQLTRFKCGGVCLGIANDHHAADGFSALHFINTWSTMARDLGSPTSPPFLDRRALCARCPPQPKFDHIEYKPPPVTKSPNQATSEIIIYKRFQLSRDKINYLKDKCYKESDTNTKYSTYEVLAGHAWRCVTMARQLPRDQQTKLHIAIDGRSRLRNPKLPPGYFGNVVFHANPVLVAGDVVSNPLIFIVNEIHKDLVKIDDDYLRSAIDYLELQSDRKGIIEYLYTTKCPNLSIISWVGLPFYDANFGWGKPAFVGPGVVPNEGKSHILRSPMNDGSVLYAIALPQEEMGLFEKLFYQI